jgi:hypothetical protein
LLRVLDFQRLVLLYILHSTLLLLPYLFHPPFVKIIITVSSDILFREIITYPSKM